MEKERPTSIRDIEISERREEFNHRKEPINTENSSKGVSYKAKNKKIWPKFLAFGIFAILVFTALSFAFHSASILVKPKTEKLTFSNDIFTATVDDKNFTASVSENKAKSGKISKGKITITNNTSKKQNLREETRFQIGEGDSKIVYKIYKKVTIPAGKTVTVSAFSDGSGEKYNKSKGTKLKIPGFKEASMNTEYEKITGEIAEDFKTSDEDLKNSENSKTENKEKKESLATVKYRVLEITAEDSKQISSIGVEEVSEKATGKIKITNNTNKTQKLRKETRFGNDGLIFKTYKSVTIPAKKSVIVDAFADEAGEKYNIEKGIKFDVPGFKEAKMDNEYKNIFGVSETAFTGGVVGKKNIPNKDELEKAKKDLEKSVLDTLAVKSKKNTQKGDFILVGNNPYTQYNFKTKSVDNKVEVSVKAIQKIPIIMKKDFIAMILKSENITTEKIDQLDIKDLSDIELRILSPETFNIDSGDNFQFSVKGNAKVVWVLDKDLLIKSIKGNSTEQLKEKLDNSFKNFEFNISISPFWRSTVPEDEDSISVEIEE